MSRLLLLSLVLVVPFLFAQPPSAPRGILPAGADGKPLNLDFETGDLRDWTAEGDAFKDQPIKGDTVVKRRADNRSEHQGEYWIGGYEKHGDKPQGTLTSVAFKVTHRWAAFLVGGGPYDTTCVELVRKDSGKVFHRSSGHEAENMDRVVVDLQEHLGKEIFIRLVDRHSGHWGHINFDDFRFFETKPNYPKTARSPADIFPYAGLTPEKAAEAMTVPEGFKVTAFAGEPDIRQPIAMTIDDRGRLWVAEAYSYPTKLPRKDAKDRILIFEDTDGDGKFDKRTVFYEGLNLVSGLEVGFGGVWVGQAPELLFIPIKDGEDKPAGPPQVVLDGWGLEDTHETLNSFIWGPDGWLYGCHGVFTHSAVGKPGTPKEQRVRINAGIWRYHPIKQKFEVFAEGTSNPWGVDFNDRGDAFLTCCVIPHLFHVIPGARYQRQAGNHFNPNTYADIPTIANHRHWIGNQWNEADRAKSDASGGGHAHAGAMVYLGDAWPAKYRGQLFMNNIHGARINVDRLTPKGSGYAGDGEPDFLKANDLWSQILYLRYGPDGQVYMIDWYDRNQCHHGNWAGHDRSNGRIFKICYQASRERERPEKTPARLDLSKASVNQLIDYQNHKNDWYVRQARRILMERAAAKKLPAQARELLATRALSGKDENTCLRNLWALHVTGGLSETQTLHGLEHAGANLRAWTIRLACENGTPSAAVVKRMVELARKDESPVVRLALASAMQRISAEAAWEIAAALLQHGEDVSDHNLPLMVWYGVEPLAGADPKKGLTLAVEGKIPLVSTFLARRIAAQNQSGLEMVVTALGAADEGIRKLLLRGVKQALTGRRQAPMPPDWPKLNESLLASKDAEVRDLARELSVVFGDPATLRAMRLALDDPKLTAAQKRAHLASLLAARDRELVPVLYRLLKDKELRGDALRGLAVYDDPKTPEMVLAVYPSLSYSERRDALSTLSSRVPYARALLAAIGAKKVPATDLTADLVRQLRNLKDADVDKQITTVWGVVRESPEDKAKLIAQYKKLVSSPVLPSELPRGRAVFAKVCQQCHTLFDAGGKVGPELTGSNRRDLDYLLPNIIDPSAVMAREYIPSIVATKAGRFVTGIIKEQTANAITVVTANESIVIPRDEIESITPGEKSMMPDDLLKPLKDDEVRALVAYLGSSRQVPMAATEENAAGIFNGKDLAGWHGDAKLWRVEKGEIVGKSPGIKKNEFLIGEMEVGDFKLTVDVKLTPNAENSGVQFRSEELPGGEVKGYQADVGAGWWGKLYEEHGRGLLTTEGGEKHVKPDEWNRYEIVAAGSRIKTYINGQLCVDIDDPKGARRGIIALQIHSGGPMEVRFRNFKLEVK